jgi:hypothetical protein
MVNYSDPQIPVGYLAVYFSSEKSGILAYDPNYQWLLRGVVWISPEGKRHEDHDRV